uniref:Nucleoside phosphorylase domain-containing protein n=1 Tax=Parascaris univalens TaxID=6257 RepID=A0A915A0I4_PARUN
MPSFSFITSKYYQIPKTMGNAQGTIDDSVAENNNNSVVPLLNPIMAEENEDFLYHFGISKTKDNIPTVFGDVKFVCTGGSGPRLALFAEMFSKETGVPCSDNLSKSDRFVMYKAGPVLWINHGMGNPSISIMLVEVIKLLHYAGASNVRAFRLGTSGGVGVEPGTVVLSTSALNGELQEYHIQYILGKKVLRSTLLNHSLIEELAEMAKKVSVPAECGKTLCADDFYEGQARLDGEFCAYTSKDKYDFLQTLYKKGVRNIEMESTCFASMFRRVCIPAAVVCVTLLNRMKGDQIQLDKETYTDYEMRPFKLVTAYIKEKMKSLQ